jgi:serine phosphatase RsbU (regulator of sigma subunit)
MMAEAEYTAQNFTLQPGDRLTLMTDGVVEATNAAKQLFGFERAREISREGVAAIAHRRRALARRTILRSWAWSLPELRRPRREGLCKVLALI